MEKTVTEKDSYINWSWKEDDPETVRIFAGEEILKEREDSGNQGAVIRPNKRGA